jgi:hypothetical protein
MTNEQVIKRINEIREILADYRELTSYDHEALDIAISALSKQCASSGQADQCGNDTEMVELKLKKRTITERLIIAKSLIDSVIADSESDQFREDTKKTDSERVSLLEQEKSNSFSEKPSEEGNSEMNCSDVPDIHVGKTDFKPGDKFILELGQERKMFGEFEITGTDLYVKTSLLEKLKRYELEPVTDCHDLMGDLLSRKVVIDAIYKNGCNTRRILDAVEALPSAQPEIIHCNSCKHWTQSTGKMKGYGLGRCDFHDTDLVTCNGFCYWAERRNDG